MKTLTLVPGVKITFDEDCDQCISKDQEIADLKQRLMVYEYAVNRILEFKPKEVKNNWDLGFNNAVGVIHKKVFETLEQR